MQEIAHKEEQFLERQEMRRKAEARAEAAKEVERRKFEHQSKVKPSVSRLTPVSSRQRHNKTLLADRATRNSKMLAWLTSHRQVLAPFVEQSVLKKLQPVAGASKEKDDGAATQPASIVNGKMREYQRVGLAWMLRMYDCGGNPILGDEMGLGKTLQTIAFIAALKERGVGGPSLIVVPMSVISSWMNECRKW